MYQSCFCPMHIFLWIMRSFSSQSVNNAMFMLVASYYTLKCCCKKYNKNYYVPLWHYKGGDGHWLKYEWERSSHSTWHPFAEEIPPFKKWSQSACWLLHKQGKPPSLRRSAQVRRPEQTEKTCFLRVIEPNATNYLWRVCQILSVISKMFFKQSI